MKKGTRIGWLLVALSIVLSVWVITSQHSEANQTTTDGFELSDDGTELISYAGSGGSITIPSTVTTIDAGVFSDDTTITGVTLSSATTSLGEGAFAGCTALSGVSLGNITAIRANTFYGCTSLSSVTIPSTVTSIGYRAFYNTSMSGITIPSSVTSIDLKAFEESKNLTNIAVSSGNSTYSSVDGCVYNASSTRLLLVPEGKSSVSISGSATTIASSAFNRCQSIASLTVPDSITTIESDAFSGSTISTITIPKTTTSIGEQSGWTPAVIYGYEGTAADKYAAAHSITFIVLGTDDNNTDNNNTNTNSNNTADNTNTGATTDTSATTPTTGLSGGASTTSGGSSNVAADGTHQKDATPTTADGDIDPRFILCAAIFAGGIAILVNGRRKKAIYTSIRHEDDLDD